MAERASRTEKNDRENSATLPAVPTAAATAKQNRKRKTELVRAKNKKKLDSARSKTRVDGGLVGCGSGGRWVLFLVGYFYNLA